MAALKAPISVNNLGSGLHKIVANITCGSAPTASTFSEFCLAMKPPQPACANVWVLYLTFDKPPMQFALRTAAEAPDAGAKVFAQCNQTQYGFHTCMQRRAEVEQQVASVVLLHASSPTRARTAALLATLCVGWVTVSGVLWLGYRKLLTARQQQQPSSSQSQSSPSASPPVVTPQHWQAFHGYHGLCVLSMSLSRVMRVLPGLFFLHWRQLLLLPLSPLLYNAHQPTKVWLVAAGFASYVPYADGRRAMATPADALRFVTSRLSRLLPLYFLVVLLLLTHAPDLSTAHHGFWHQLLLLATMVYPYSRTTHHLNFVRVVNHVHSIAEMLPLYLLFPPLLLAHRARPTATLVASILLSAAVRGACIRAYGSPFTGTAFLVDSFLGTVDTFALGMATYDLIRALRRAPPQPQPQPQTLSPPPLLPPHSLPEEEGEKEAAAPVDGGGDSAPPAAAAADAGVADTAAPAADSGRGGASPTLGHVSALPVSSSLGHVSPLAVGALSMAHSLFTYLLACALYDYSILGLLPPPAAASAAHLLVQLSFPLFVVPLLTGMVPLAATVLRFPPLRLLGQMRYSIYLVQAPLFALWAGGDAHSLPLLPWLQRVASAAAHSSLLAWLMFSQFERRNSSHSGKQQQQQQPQVRKQQCSGCCVGALPGVPAAGGKSAGSSGDASNAADGSSSGAQS